MTFNINSAHVFTMTSFELISSTKNRTEAEVVIIGFSRKEIVLSGVPSLVSVQLVYMVNDVLKAYFIFTSNAVF